MLDAIVGEVDDAGLRARPWVVRSSYPAGALADLAETLDVDLVAMSSHARGGSARIALGSVTMGVVGLAHAPVLVTRMR